MTDAATKLAEELREKAQAAQNYYARTGGASRCLPPLIADAVRAADMLLELARDGEAVRATNFLLREAVRQSEADSQRLDFIIACGPPGASNREWLSDEAWEAATYHVHDAAEDHTDRRAMRAAIDAARNATQEKP